MAKTRGHQFENLGFENLGSADLGFRKTNDPSPVLTLKSGHWFCVKYALTLLISRPPLMEDGDRREFMVGALCGLRAPG
jgi:hypothetical protein